ncbi:MAG TPA: hypothetical protein VE933_08180 [Chitinophagaceae bacterium]|nr:hypothetical protein [Chitinophagaceae bacterium]
MEQPVNFACLLCLRVATAKQGGAELWSTSVRRPPERTGRQRRMTSEQELSTKK